MSSAYELLKSIVGVDKTLVIDNDLRTIDIPSVIKNIGVEKDDEVLVLNFRMPATYCGFDLSKFEIRINYLNGNAEEDVYEVDNASVIDDHISFSWLVGPHATLYKGNVAFSVSLKKLAANGEVLKRFNTAPATLPVLQGLETSEKAISEYNDIFEQWRAKLFGVGDTEEAKIIAASEAQQQAIEIKGAATLATIPEDYTETYNMAKEAHRTKADAIIIETEGEVISVNDSSDDCLRGLNVLGKTTQFTTTGRNLLDLDEHLSFTGVYELNVSIAPGTYMLRSAKETHTGQYVPHLRFYTNNIWMILDGAGVDRSVVISQEETKVYIYSNGMSASASVGISAEIDQIILSADGGEYEPYTGGAPAPNPDYPQEMVSVTNPTVSVFGKNLLKETAIPPTSSGNGITCDYEGNGIFHIYGTHTCQTQEIQLAGTNLFIPVDPSAKYTMSVKVVEGILPGKFHPFLGVGSDTVSFRNWFSVFANAEHTPGTVLSDTRIPSDALGDVKHITRFWIYNYNPDNTPYTADFRLQIWLEKGDKSTSYTPFTEQTVPLSHSLNAIPVQSNGNYVDENGQQWVCDEVDFEKGLLIQRCYKETLTFMPQTELNRYSASLTHEADKKYGFDNGIPVICDKYIYDPACGSGAPMVNGIRIAATSPKYCIAYYNGEVIDTATVLYPLATPIEIALSETELAQFKMACTNYHNTTIVNDQEAWMKVKYNADTQEFIKAYVAAEISKYLGGDGV